ncbi:MAG: dienelactone hydrolase family protein [Planctomycetes bacterium]|nr:dienelactone hydrolase family protein [Planctomycetota bacterium]
MPRITLLFLLVLASPRCGAQTAVAPGPKPIEAKQLFALLNAGRERELAGQDLDRLYGILKAGRPFPTEVTAAEGVVPFEDAFGRKTRIYLRVPPRPRAVLILLHGLGGNETQLARAVSGEVLDREGMILLAPCAQGEPLAHTNGDLGLLAKVQAQWWSYDERGIVMQSLLGLARQYGFDRNRVYLCGHSMGGFGVWNLGLRFADRFAAAASLSGGLSRREYLGSKPHRRFHLLLDNAIHLPMLFAHGDRDEIVPVAFERRLHEELTEREIEHRYLEIRGAGHLVDLGDRGPIMPALREHFLGSRRDPHPRRVMHRVIEDRPSRSFWLGIDRLWASTGRVEGRILSDHEIELRSSGVERLTVFLDEALIDLDRPLRLRVNGKVVHEGRVAPSLKALLASWRGREDPAFVCRAALEIDVP